MWGQNPEQFDPDRFSPENRAKIPPNAYKPFGTGQRACVGRQFALQEANLVLSMLLQRFEIVDHANYQLDVKQTLTLKPNNFYIKVKRRAGRTATAPLADARPAVASQPAAQPVAVSDLSIKGHHTPLLVLYGSNLGTAEGLAHTTAQDATNRDPLQDFLYEDAMRAFSRQPGKPKTYVQQAIQEQSEAVWRLLQQEAVIFVCRDASRMAPDVRKAFVGVFQERTGASAADAHAWLTGLVVQHRYLEDIWASAT